MRHAGRLSPCCTLSPCVVHVPATGHTKPNGNKAATYLIEPHPAKGRHVSPFCAVLASFCFSINRVGGVSSACLAPWGARGLPSSRQHSHNRVFVTFPATITGPPSHCFVCWVIRGRVPAASVAGNWPAIAGVAGCSWEHPTPHDLTRVSPAEWCATNVECNQRDMKTLHLYKVRKVACFSELEVGS